MTYFLSITIDKLPILRVIYFIKLLLSIMCIIVPIILIVVSTIELLKLLFKPEESKKSMSRIINKMLSGVVIFFVPIIINFVMGMISQNTTDKIELWANADNITIKKLTILKEKETAAKKHESDTRKLKKLQDDITKKIDELNSLMNNLGDNLPDKEKAEIQKAIDEAQVTIEFKLSDDKRQETINIINKLKTSEMNAKYELDALEQILDNQAEGQNKELIEQYIDKIQLSILELDKVSSEVNLNFETLKQNLDFSKASINDVQKKLKALNTKSSNLRKEIEKERRRQEKQNKPSGNIVYAAGNSKGDEIVNYAISFVGKIPYVYGGTSLTTGVDCSGFVMRVYEHFGYSLPRSTYEQKNFGTRVPLTNLQKGDLVFSRNYNHVTMYIGDGQVVQAQCTACGPVKITKIPSNAIDAVRIIND